MRCFIAIEVPENIKTRAVLIQKELSKLPMVCKFVEPENIHITLSFLGELDDKEVRDVCSMLDSVCSRYKKFEVHVQTLKMIPSPSYIRVLAFEVASGGGEIKSLSTDIKKSVDGKIKPPHLTLCRVRNITNKSDVVAGVHKIESAILGKFVVSSVCLMKSDLERTGPVYSRLHESKLSY